MKRPFFFTSTLILFLLVLFSSCDKEFEYRSGELTVPVCTGFVLRSVNNELLGLIGKPNNKLAGSRPETIATRITTYPNPLADYFAFSTNYDGHKNIWLVAAHTTVVFDQSLSYLNGKQVHVGGLPLVSFSNVSDNTVWIDVSNLPPGVYRLYAEMGGELYWENIIVM